MPAKGFAEWKGDLQSGGGTFTAGDTISGARLRSRNLAECHPRSSGNSAVGCVRTPRLN